MYRQVMGHQFATPDVDSNLFCYSLRAPSFYAVKVGRQTGIFGTWFVPSFPQAVSCLSPWTPIFRDECQQSTQGYPGQVPVLSLDD